MQRLVCTALALVLLPQTALASDDDIHWFDGFAPPPAGEGLNDKVLAMTEYDGQLVVGGDFTMAGDLAVNYLAQWTGDDWLALGSGPDGVVSALGTWNGQLVIGGAFTSAGGVPASKVAVWDGATWSALGLGVDATVKAIVEFEGDLVVGGHFLNAGGAPASYIARWDGVAWSEIGGGMDSRVEVLAVYDGDLIAGGLFDNAGGTLVNHVARWDGVAWQSMAGGMSARVRALTVWEGSLAVGGDFETAGGVAALRVALWDGATWSSLGGGADDEVFALASYNGYLVAGGAFLDVDGVSASRVAAWNASEWLSMTTGADDDVLSLTRTSGDLYLGGRFGVAGSASSAFIARWGDASDKNHWLPAEFATLQAAIDFAADYDDRLLRDTLRVCAGEYGDGAVTDKVVQIIGSGTEVTSLGILTFVDSRLAVTGKRAGNETQNGGHLERVTLDELVGDVWSLRVDSVAVQIVSLDCIDAYIHIGRSEIGFCELNNWICPDGYLTVDESDLGDLYLDSCGSATVSNSSAQDLYVYGESNAEVSRCTAGRATVRGWAASVGASTLGTAEVSCRPDGAASIGACTVFGDVTLDGDGDNTQIDFVAAGGNLILGSLTVGGADETYIEGNTIVTPISRPYAARLAVSDSPFNRMTENVLVGGRVGLQVTTGSVAPECNNVFGAVDEPYGGLPDLTGVDGNISVDPQFCDAIGDDYTLAETSPCLPGNHPDGYDCGLIGALGQGCGPALANLAPAGFVCLPDSAAAWADDPDSLRIGAIVINDGNLTSGTFDVRIEIEGCVGFWGDTQMIGPLSPGEVDTVFAGPFAVEPYQCTVSVFVDYNDDETESSELDNDVVDASVCTVVGVPVAPEEVTLRVWPSPARSMLFIRGVPRGDRVRVYDIAGRLIRILPTTGGGARWNLRTESRQNVPNGVYFVSVDHAGSSDVRRIVVRH